MIRILANEKISKEVVLAANEFVLVLSEKSRFWSQKILHNDNLIDCLLNWATLPKLKSQLADAAYLSSEILANLLQACGSQELRSKFVLTLKGVERLIQSITETRIETDEDLDYCRNQFDAIGVCVLDNRENCNEFY